MTPRLRRSIPPLLATVPLILVGLVPAAPAQAQSLGMLGGGNTSQDSGCLSGTTTPSPALDAGYFDTQGRRLAGYRASGTVMQVGERRLLTYPAMIGRIEVDRAGVIGVAAPGSDSLAVTATGEGEAQLTVFNKAGEVLGRETLSVMAPGTILPPGPQPGQKVVAVDVQFAAVSSSTLKALGFSFARLSGDLQGAVVAPSTLNSFSGLGGNGNLSIDAATPIRSAFNLFLSGPNRGVGAILSALSTNGLSQILAQPTLLVRSGERASFLAGGEFPVPVPQSSGFGGGTLSIAYKKFGVCLSVEPYVITEKNIVLKISPEVSELDYANGVQLQGYTVPGIRRRSAETTVELGSGQSFVIAGLNYSNSTITKEKVPLLGDLPILGAFFKRQQNQKERQELIIVATPRLVTPDAAPPALPASVTQPLDPGFGQMIVGNDGVGKASQGPFGVVRR